MVCVLATEGLIRPGHTILLKVRATVKSKHTKGFFMLWNFLQHKTINDYTTYR
jgi:hypothetical protein